MHYFNFKTQEYLFDYDINSSGHIYTGYKITDLIKSLIMVTWIPTQLIGQKADFVFALSYNHRMTSLTYNGKM